MSRGPGGPLPPKDGLTAARLRMPRAGGWDTVWDFLRDRHGIPAPELRRRARDGELVLESGRVVDRGTPYRPGSAVHLHRDAPDEAAAGALDAAGAARLVIHRDADLVVVDKPHDLATTPGGEHVARSVVVALRRALDLPELAPAHRLDRDTAGVLLLTARRGARRPYQEAFAAGRVTKTYEAVAPVRSGLDLPRTVRSRIEKTPGVLAAVDHPLDERADHGVDDQTEQQADHEADQGVDRRAGQPGSRAAPAGRFAETRVELLGVRDRLGLYRLTPRTGRTHQIRVHLASLGVPVLGDPIYPVVRPLGEWRGRAGAGPRDGAGAAPDEGLPLQLLARELELTDPLTGSRRVFTSRRRLAAWTPC